MRFLEVVIQKQKPDDAALTLASKERSTNTGEDVFTEPDMHGTRRTENNCLFLSHF